MPSTSKVGSRLGIPECLGFSQHIGKPALLPGHFTQNEVAGTVDDTGQPLDLVGGQAFADRLYHRNAGGYGGFEPDKHTLAARRFEQCVSMRGNQRLVGGDHRLAGFDGGHHQAHRRFFAPHGLDHDIHGRIRDDRRLDRLSAEGPAPWPPPWQGHVPQPSG